MNKPKYDPMPLVTARLKRGWSMSELARRIGVTPPIVSRVESGESQGPKTVAKMAAELGVSMSRLVR